MAEHPLTPRIRAATDGDIAALESVALAMGVPPGRDDFPRCLAEQAAGKRALLVAVRITDGQMLGYVQVKFAPLYQPFRRLNIPEIQDLNVIPAARQQGLGGALVQACEDLARARGDTMVGIGVGLVASFGAAQRLYISRGYRPDGAGVCYDDVPVRVGSLVAVDDMLTIKLIKTL